MQPNLLADPAQAKSKHIPSELIKLEDQFAQVSGVRENLQKKCDELIAQAQAASETDHMKLLLDLNKAEGDQFLVRSKIAQRIRVLIEEIRVFPPTQDRTIILNWANKQVTEIEIGIGGHLPEVGGLPMFNVALQNNKKSSYFLNNSPVNTPSEPVRPYK